MRAALVFAGFVTSIGNAAASPGAIVVPPAELELGAGVPFGDTVVGPSTELRAGMHWASLSSEPTPVDVGIGYIGSFRAVAPAYIGRTTDSTDQPHLSLNGIYAQAAYAIEDQPHWRTWVGARFEGLIGGMDGRSLNTVGVALRVATEMYVAGKRAGADRSVAAVCLGTFAIGIYVEAFRRWLPLELGAVGVSAGLTMRVPFIAAIGV